MGATLCCPVIIAPSTLNCPIETEWDTDTGVDASVSPRQKGAAYDGF